MDGASTPIATPFGVVFVFLRMAKGMLVQTR